MDVKDLQGWVKFFEFKAKNFVYLLGSGLFNLNEERKLKRLKSSNVDCNIHIIQKEYKNEVKKLNETMEELQKLF